MSSGTLSPPQGQPGPPVDPDPREAFIDNRLRRTRRQVKGVDIATGLLVLLIGTLGYLFAAAIIDHWLIAGGLGFWGRLVLLLGLLGGASWQIARGVLPPLIHRINPIFAAHTIEQSQPSLKNSLVNFLLLRGHRDEVSQPVYRTLEHRAAADLSQIEIESAVDRIRVIRLGYLLVGTMAVCCLYLVLSPKSPLSSAARVLWPWSSVAAPTRVTIDDVRPGDAVVFHGDFVTVSAEVRGLRPDEPVALYYSTADGQSVDQKIPMTPPEDGFAHQVQCRLPAEELGLQQDVTYYLSAGDSTTRRFTVGVQTAPTILVDRVEYDYPDYTGLANQTVSHQGDLRAIEGTQVTIYAAANRNIASAKIDLGCTGLRELDMKPSGERASGRFVLRLRADDATLPEFDCYQLRFRDDAGQANPQPPRHRIEVIRDLPPEIELVSPTEDEVAVAENGRLEIRLRARDPDFALRRVAVRAECDGRSLVIPPLLNAPHPNEFQAEYVFEPAQARFEGDGSDPAACRLKAGDRVRYWAEADDNKQPTPGHSTTAQQWITIVAAPVRSAGRQPTMPRARATRDPRRAVPTANKTANKTGRQAANKTGSKTGSLARRISRLTGVRQIRPSSRSHPTSHRKTAGHKTKARRTSHRSRNWDRSRDRSRAAVSRISPNRQRARKATGRPSRAMARAMRRSRTRPLKTGRSRAAGRRANRGSRSTPTPSPATQSKRSSGTRKSNSDSRAAKGRPIHRPATSRPTVGSKRVASPTRASGAAARRTPPANRILVSSPPNPAATQSRPRGSRTGKGTSVQGPRTRRRRSQAMAKGLANLMKPGAKNRPSNRRAANPTATVNNRATASRPATRRLRRRRRGRTGRRISRPARRARTPASPGNRRPNRPAPAPTSRTPRARPPAIVRATASRAAGQRSPRSGAGAAGSQTEAQQGGSAGQEQGEGPTGSEAGDQVETDQQTGNSAARQGGARSGDSGKPGEDGGAGDEPSDQDDPAGEPSSQDNPSDGQQPGSRPSSGSGAQNQGIPGGGGGDQSANTPPPEAVNSGGDAANLDYARQATDLALEHLQEQMDQDDSELLDRLGWTREEARKFIEKWTQMKQAAARDGAEGNAARQQLDRAIESLGLAPRARSCRAARPARTACPGSARPAGSILPAIGPISSGPTPAVSPAAAASRRALRGLPPAFRSPPISIPPTDRERLAVDRRAIGGRPSTAAAGGLPMLPGKCWPICSTWPRGRG